MSLRSRWYYSYFIDGETEAKSNWFIQLTSIRSTALNQAWLNLLFMTRFIPKLGYTSEWGELVKIQIPRDGPMGSVFLISPQVQLVLGPHSGTTAELTSHHSGPESLNLTKGSPLPNSYPLTWPNQAFIRPLSSSQASELWPQAWERAFNKMHVCYASWSCPNPCLSAPWSLALFPLKVLLALLSPPYKRKAFPVWFWDACRSWDLSVHPLATAFLNKVAAYRNPDLFFYWQSPQLRTRPQASHRFLHRGEKLHIILGSFVQTANWLGVWPPGLLWSTISGWRVLVPTVDLSDLSFRTQSLAFEHQALWGPSDNRLGIFSFFPSQLEDKGVCHKILPSGDTPACLRASSRNALQSCQGSSCQRHLENWLFSSKELPP